MLGGEAGLFFPFSRATRLEATVGFYRQEEDSDILYYGLELPYGQFFNGMAMPLTIALVNETTRFANYGPNQGFTFRLEASKYIKLGNNYQDAWTFQGDVRKYFRLDNNTLFAFRLHGFHSTGDNSVLYGAGGNNTIRSVGYYQMVGTNLFYFNAEFRFPLINLAATPLGLVGPLRGIIFFDLGGAWFKGEEFRMFEEGNFRLRDAIASYGYGLEFFLGGYPMHVEWIWRWDFDQRQYMGVNFWVGFSF